MSELSPCESSDCGAVDDHPKFHVLGGSQVGPSWITYHHDCAASLGFSHAGLIVRATQGSKGDELREKLTDGNNELHQAVLDNTLREAASIYVTNRRTLGDPLPTQEELVEYLASSGSKLSDGVVNHVAHLVGPTMSAIKQDRATNFLNVELGSGSFTARTGAVVLELDTAIGSQSTNSTPVTGGSYADQVCAFGTASVQTETYSGQIANTGTPTFTNMPATTVVSIELKDSAGTPVRLQYGNLAASKTTNSGDTISVAAGAITVSI